MKFRCPYCKADLGASTPAQCPACEKFIVYPNAQTREMKISHRKLKERIWREHDMQMEQLQSSPAGSFRIPKKAYLLMALVLFILGMALWGASKKAVARRVTINPVARTMRSVDALAQALGRYRHDTGRFPDAESGLVALVRDPGVKGWRGAYVNQVRNDIWSTAYVYEPPADDAGVPVLFSCGPDRKPGTDDDIRPAPERYRPTRQWLAGRLERSGKKDE